MYHVLTHIVYLFCTVYCTVFQKLLTGFFFPYVLLLLSEILALADNAE